ncbi:hypothetical protein RB601_005957 [Gaeumannomyces tritici]
MILRANTYARDPAISESVNSTIATTTRAPPPPPSSASPDPLAAANGPRETSSPAAGASENYIPLFVVIAVLGLVLLIMAGMVIYTMARRHRRRRSEAAEDFLSARRRDPNLTWEEYERSRKLTHSTVMLEEERVRVAMIDKSLRSRASVDQPALSERAPSIPDEPLPPTPASPRVRTNWVSGRLRRQRANSDGTDDFDADDKEMLLGGASPSPVSSPSVLQPPHCVWRDVGDSASAGSGTPSSGSRPSSSGNHNSHRTRSNSTGNNSPRPSPSSSQRWLWELPDGKKCPPAWANARWGGDNRDAPPPVPPPSLRTRTPPIWAHPAFRPEGGAGTIVARSFTNDTGIYPSEMARVKPASLV